MSKLVSKEEAEAKATEDMVAEASIEEGQPEEVDPKKVEIIPPSEDLKRNILFDGKDGKFKFVLKSEFEKLYGDLHGDAAWKMAQSHIQLHWSKSKQHYFAIGAHLNICKEREGKHGDWGKWVGDHLPFGQSTASKLMKIASTDLFQEVSTFKALPNSWNTLYELAVIAREDPAKFKKAVKDGTVTSDMTKDQVLSLSPRQSNEASQTVNQESAEDDVDDAEDVDGEGSDSDSNTSSPSNSRTMNKWLEEYINFSRELESVLPGLTAPEFKTLHTRLEEDLKKVKAYVKLKAAA